MGHRGSILDARKVVRRIGVASVAVLSLGSLAAAPSGPPPERGDTGATATSAARQYRPNVVVIMADDMRQDDLRWMPRTRRLIGGQGARFTNAFSSYALCCPARASFLTGQYTHNHHVWGVAPEYGFHSFRDGRTLPVWLRRSGYRTLFLGKYLNGYGYQRTPGGRRSLRYVPRGWNDWRGAIDRGLPPDHPKAGRTYNYYDTTLNVNGRLVGHQGQYQTHMLGRQSTSMIRQYAPSPRPFFLWANYVAPHHGQPSDPDDPRRVKRNDGRWITIDTPAVPPDVRGRFDSLLTRPPGLPGERSVADKPSFIRKQPAINRRERRAMREAARQRAEALSILDRQVARTIGALRRTGELRRTLVIFTSDNGYFQGEHRRRQGKTIPYEPALRIPLLMRGPGIAHGVKRNAPFLMIDFAPTILRAAKTDPRASIDGQPMLQVARDGGGRWRRGVVVETGPPETIEYARAPDPEPRTPVRPFSVGVRTSRYLYLRHLTGEVELYDMRRDPNQHNNVAAQGRYTDIQNRLAGVLRVLRDCSGRECRRPLSSW